MPAAVRARAKLRKHSLANADAILANGGRLLDDDELAADEAGPVPSDEEEEDEESSEQEEEAEAPAGRRGSGARGAAKPSAKQRGGGKEEDDSDDSAFMPADYSKEGGGVDAAVTAFLRRQEDAARPLAKGKHAGKPAAQHSSGKALKLVPAAKAKAAKVGKAAPAAAKRAAPASAPASPRAAKKPKTAPASAHAHALQLPSLEDTLAAALAEEPFFELVAHAVKENALTTAESFAFMGTLAHADAKEQARSAMRLRMRMRFA
jgi:hypothetical protein